MTEQILISIIVPVYNVEEYLEKCILSIMNQTYKNLQIILVNDGSTDESGKICDFYEQRDKRIEVIHQMNAGLVCARKKGLERAKGEYIGFVDGDDYIDKEMYACMLEDLIASQADFIHTGYFEENKNNIRTKLKYEDKIYDIRSNRIQFLRNQVFGINDNNDMSFSIVSKLFKKDLIVKCYQKVPDTQSYGEDLLSLCVRILESDFVYMRKKAFYHYIRRENSITNKNWLEIEIKLGNLYKCVRDLMEKYDCYKLLEDSIERWFQVRMFETVLADSKVDYCIHRYFYPEIESLKGKKIILYGAGMVGQDYYAQIAKYQECRIVAWGDKDVRKHKNEYMNIISPEKLNEYEFDILIIAVNSYDTAQQIKKELLEKGIYKEKIKWLKPRYL